jgi:hypothetical protein
MTRTLVYDPHVERARMVAGAIAHASEPLRGL